jgi:hypothetical protein
MGPGSAAGTTMLDEACSSSTASDSHFKQPNTKSITVIASASEAIHAATKKVRVDCFVADAFRNDA